MRRAATAEAAPPLKYRRLWWMLGWLLVAGVCVGSLLPGRALEGVQIGDKWLHAGSYCLLMIWFGGLHARGPHFSGAVLLAGLGLALDVLQLGVPSRTFDWLDVAADAAGVLVGFALTRSVLAGWCLRVERLLLA
jgi:VanZ family protein